MLARLSFSRRDAAVVAAALVAATLNIAFTHPPAAVRWCVAVPLLFAPGYVLTRSLFPRAKLSIGERGALTVGLSVAVVILLGLCLNEFPGGLNRKSWSASLGVATAIIFVLTVPARRRTRSGREPASAALKVSFAALLTAAIALLIAFAGLGIDRRSALDHEHQTHFTSLWALPLRSSGEPNRVKYGVSNHEGVPQAYVVVMRANGVEQESRSFQLPAGRMLVDRFSAVNSAQAVTIDLYRGTRIAGPPYREVSLWLSANVSSRTG